LEFDLQPGVVAASVLSNTTRVNNAFHLALGDN
jgi:hypothetical protein